MYICNTALIPQNEDPFWSFPGPRPPQWKGLGRGPLNPFLSVMLSAMGAYQVRFGGGVYRGNGAVKKRARLRPVRALFVSFRPPPCSQVQKFFRTDLSSFKCPALCLIIEVCVGLAFWRNVVGTCLKLHACCETSRASCFVSSISRD